VRALVRIAKVIAGGNSREPVMVMAGIEFTSKGVLSIAACARRRGIANLVVPSDNAAEAAVTQGIHVFGMRHLAEVVTTSLRRQARSVRRYEAVRKQSTEPEYASPRKTDLRATSARRTRATSQV
jgi:predicted ATPase with chaperone activity